MNIVLVKCDNFNKIEANEDTQIRKLFSLCSGARTSAPVLNSLEKKVDLVLIKQLPHLEPEKRTVSGGENKGN